MRLVKFIWLEKCIQGAVERIVLKILICVQSTAIELLRFGRNRWVRIQRVKPERELYKNISFSVLHNEVKNRLCPKVSLLTK